MSARPTRASRDLTHLMVQQLLSPRGRGRGSRSPSPAAHVGASAFFPAAMRGETANDTDNFVDAESESSNFSNNADVGTMATIPTDATVEQLRAIAMEAIAAAAQERERANAAQAAANATAATWRRKKPELPAFDKQHVDLWIKRVESAYHREGITLPKDKFAFLESILGVDLSPTINEYLFGDATEENWTRFLEHLRSEYGHSKAQRVAAVLDDLKRDGHRPSHLLAHLRERTQDVTMDDVYKEKILRALPVDVRRTLQSQLKLLDAEGLGELADTHFDQQGRQLNAPPEASTVNAVTEDDDDDAPINSINRRPNNSRNRGGFYNGSRSNNFSGPRSGSAANSLPRPAGRPAAPTSLPNEKLCLFHKRYGDDTRNCQTGCSRFDPFTAARNAGNGRGGRR